MTIENPSSRNTSKEATMMVDNNDERYHINLEKEVKAQIFEESSESDVSCQSEK